MKSLEASNPPFSMPYKKDENHLQDQYYYLEDVVIIIISNLENGCETEKASSCRFTLQIPIWTKVGWDGNSVRVSHKGSRSQNIWTIAASPESILAGSWPQEPESGTKPGMLREYVGIFTTEKNF